jgi:hypothetical protein
MPGTVLVALTIYTVLASAGRKLVPKTSGVWVVGQTILERRGALAAVWALAASCSVVWYYSVTPDAHRSPVLLMWQGSC